MIFLTDVKKIFTVWKRVFSKAKYLTVGFISAIAFYLLNGFIVSRPQVGEFFEIYGFLALWKLLVVSANYSYYILPETFFGTIVLSLLVGALIGLLVYRFDNFAHVRGGNIFAAFGIFLGMAAPGCAACGVGLISLLGLGSILAVLPYNGREVMGVAIIVSGWSVFLISRKLHNPVCDIQNKNIKSKQTQLSSTSPKIKELKGGNKNEQDN